MSEKFEYKYSAPTLEERKEIESIAKQYEPKDKTITKMDRLRYLDNKVKTIPMILSLTIGIIGILVFGLGLTLVLEWDNLPLGIVVMVIGCAIMAIAYLVYSISSKKLKAKYSEEILALSEELLNQDSKK